MNDTNDRDSLHAQDTAAETMDAMPSTSGSATAEVIPEALPAGEPLHGDHASVAPQFAHPNWIVASQVLRVGRQMANFGKYENRQASCTALRQIWRSLSSEDFEKQIALEVQSQEFAVQFQAHGGSPMLSHCMALMYEMTRQSISYPEFKQIKGALLIAVDQLHLEHKSGFKSGPMAWDSVERGRRLAAVKLDPRILAGKSKALRARDQLAAKKLAQAVSREHHARLEREKAESVRQENVRAMLDWMTLQGQPAGSLSTDLYDLLQGTTHTRQFREAFGGTPTPLALKNAFSLSNAAFEALKAHQAELERAVRQQHEAKLAWERSLVPGGEVPARMFITQAEYDEWLADGRLPVAKLKKFRKWSQDNVQVLHDPVELDKLSPRRIEAFRKQDLKGMTSQAASARLRSVEKLKAKQVLAGAINTIPRRHRCQALTATPTQLAWAKDVNVKVPVLLGSRKSLWPALVHLSATLPFPKNEAEVEGLSDQVGLAFSKQVQLDLVDILSGGVQAIVTEYAGAMNKDELAQLHGAMKSLLAGGICQREIAGNVKNFLKRPVAQLIKHIEESRAHELLRLKDYPQAFSLARSLDRRIHFKLGPTNSGKTHEALQALKEADSGLYLAPLRLLAMEIRDRLMADGIPCNLLTGEEHDFVQGARHTACTVEMMNPSLEVSVVVLDEIQMLLDEQRGWAWTSALVGAPARDVYVCGADTVHGACLKVINALGEQHDTTHLERKTPLEVEAAPISGGKSKKSGKGLAPGDAVIAFSRKDVLTLSARYREQGFSVATIYGALAPEVRRTESERFACGNADLVVATDCIGMGLNLPARRVVFATVHKFDGVQTRHLNPTEVRQIAGRAGRYGMHPKGLVNAFDGADLAHVRQMLAAVVPGTALLLPIAPSLWHIEALANLLGTTRIGEVLSFFATRIAAESSLFKTASLEDTIALAHAVDALSPQLSLQHKFTFACAPISKEKEREFGYFETCLRAYTQGRKLRLPDAGDLLDDRLGVNLQEAEHLSKDLTIYAWLGFKFPDTFYQHESLPALRSRVSRYIEKALLRQGGFGQTSKESFATRGKQRW